MKKKWITVVGAIVLVIGVTLAGVSFANSDQTEITAGDIRLQNQSEAQFPSLAKISLSQAVQKALGAVKGQLLKAGLEDENGFLVYGVEVVSANRTVMEVKIDAGSGKVLAQSRDEADREDHEAGEQGHREFED